MEKCVLNHPHLTRYFQSRGLSIFPPNALMLSENVMYHDESVGKTFHPAMIGAFVSPTGETVCLSRTYLADDGNGKAQVTTPKKFSRPTYPGAMRGAAIRLQRPSTILGIAEGIETAAAVFEGTGTPMWATGSANGMVSVQIPKGVKRVEIWADNDSSGVGQQSAMTLARRLYREGFAVSVMIPILPDTDWLDVYVEEGEDALWEAIGFFPVCNPSDPESPKLENAAAKTKAPETAGGMPNPIADAIEKLNERHFIVTVGGKTCIATEKRNPETGHVFLELSSQTDFNLLYQNLNVGDERASSLWLTSEKRRQYEGIVFAPGKVLPGYYNLFRGFTVLPQKGRCFLLWQHVFFVICRGNRRHYRYLRKWMAHIFQKPGELPGVAIVIRGKQGTGKTIYVDLLGDCLGQHFLVLTQMEQLTGRFNSHLKDLLLVSANEALWGGNKAGEGALKAMITDKAMAVEFKGKDIISVENYKRLIVTSNEDWPVPIGMDDRRFLVLESSDEYKEDKSYFEALANQMAKGGKEAMMYDLLREDLTGFDVRTAPRSRFGFDIKVKGAEPIVKWWYERLYVGKTAMDSWETRECQWNMTPTKDSLHANFLSFCTDHKLRTLDKPTFGRKLREMLPGGVLSDCRPTLSAPSPDDTVAALSGHTRVERPWRYKIPLLAECRHAFQLFAKAGPEIWPDEVTEEGP